MTDMLDSTIELDEAAHKGTYLTFSLDRDEFGIEIKYVTEIVGLQSITEIPELPDYVKGVINLRGKIIPVIDVRLRFKKESKAYNDRTCIVVIDIGTARVGLIVDNVAEVIPIGENEIVSPPKLSNSNENKYIKGIGKVGGNVKLLIDCEKLFGKEVESLLT